MNHILRVMTLITCEAPVDHGYFLAHQLEEAIKCAKDHMTGYDRTVIRVTPLGESTTDNRPCVVWEHNPETCKCDICIHARFDPLFTHDCPKCRFVSCMRDERSNRLCDTYVCDAHKGQDSEREYIARYSSAPADYIAHSSHMVRQFTEDQRKAPTYLAWVREETS